MTDTAQATATVTITLSRDDLEDIDAALRRSIYLWNDRNEALRVTDAFREACRAALTAAPPPAPSEREQVNEEVVRLIACMGWDACDDSDYANEIRGVVRRRRVLNISVQLGYGRTDKLAAGRPAGEGTPKT